MARQRTYPERPVRTTDISEAWALVVASYPARRDAIRQAAAELGVSVTLPESIETLDALRAAAHECARLLDVRQGLGLGTTPAGRRLLALVDCGYGPAASAWEWNRGTWPLVAAAHASLLYEAETRSASR